MNLKSKALFLCPSLSRKMGGIYEITSSLSQELQVLDIDVEAFGLIDGEWESDRSGWGAVSVRAFHGSGPKAFGYSHDLGKAVLESNADLLHLHALWMYPSILASNWKRDRKRPYFVTPNGMLEPWALANSRWKKRIAAILYEHRMLQGATCLQANTEKEFKDFRLYGLKTPIAIIPNGVDLPEEDGWRKLRHGSLSSSDCNGATDDPVEQECGIPHILLFLGRIHPKKGLANAIRGWSEVKKKRGLSWQFVIAGWDQAGHQAELVKLCLDLGLRFIVDGKKSMGENPKTGGAEIIFYGEAFGQEKENLFRAASAFILPSFSEGLPISVLEAWAYGLPVLMTPECNLPDGFSNDAALKIETNVENIVVGFNELFLMSNSDLRAMGRRGRDLVRERFTWTSVAAKMKQVYNWILGGGSPPECVITAT